MSCMMHIGWPWSIHPHTHSSSNSLFSAAVFKRCRRRPPLAPSCRRFSVKLGSAYRPPDERVQANCLCCVPETSPRPSRLSFCT